ncbi:hypothetical protein V5799_030331 [Amblyomma americanum]|uniref:Secreted protein n=1 Tax=Amblyomma americanum TaxID=6943 RepID=A0AAQ4EP93_AMBAM
MQMSAVVVALALAALIGLTFALRHADKVRDAGRGLDVDNDDAAAGENGTSANATSYEHAAVDEGGDAASSTGNGSRREEREPEPHPASGNTDNSGGQSKTPVYNARFSSVAHQPSMQATSPPPQHGPKGAESAKRILLRMNRKEWLNSRGWHLA